MAILANSDGTENIDIFIRHVKATSQPHRRGWEDATIPTRAAVTTDAMPRFTDAPSA